VPDLVVVNYHTPTDLESFLDSLDRYPPMTEATLTVVDVDVTPYEETFRWAGGEGYRIGVAGNIGYARACNLAAARGNNDVIAFFNADVELTEGALDTCTEAIAGNPAWAILGPRQVDHHRRIRHAGIFGSHGSPVHRGWNEPDRGQHVDVRTAVTVSGSAYFVKRRVWDELTHCPLYREVAPDAQGAFLPTQHYYEETWCSYHAWAHHRQVIYFGHVTIVHKWHQASPVGGWAEQQMDASRDYFRAACQHHRIPHD
jgi:hypothetical protein